MAELTPWLVQKFYETDGVTPANGHKIFTYESGTTTKKDTKVAEDGADNANPIVTNSDGTVDGLWLEAGPYKIVQAPANDTDPPTSPIKTWDRVNQSDADGNTGIVDTVAALKALSAGEFEVVQMLGHDAVGDKASGLYRWDSTSALADDGLDVIEPSTSPATGRWIRIFIDDYKPASLTALRALPEGGLSYVYLGGHTAAGDGGAGWFMWNSASTESDNDGTVIEPGSSPAAGRWIRVYKGLVNVLWFGAKGDGSTDDLASFNAAVTEAVSDRGGNGIFIPGLEIDDNVAGTANYYRLTDELLIANKSGFEIAGEGRGSLIVTDNASSANGITLDTSIQGHIHDIALQGALGSGHGIEITNSSMRNQINDIYIGWYDGDGIRNTWGINTTVDGIAIDQNNGYDPAALGNGVRGFIKNGIYVPWQSLGQNNFFRIEKSRIEAVGGKDGETVIDSGTCQGGANTTIKSETGTITTSAASTTVTGSGTAFDSDADIVAGNSLVWINDAGDQITREIDSVTNATSLELTANAGTIATGVSFSSKALPFITLSASATGVNAGDRVLIQGGTPTETEQVEVVRSFDETTKKAVVSDDWETVPVGASTVYSIEEPYYNVRFGDQNGSIDSPIITDTLMQGGANIKCLYMRCNDGDVKGSYIEPPATDPSEGGQKDTGITLDTCNNTHIHDGIAATDIQITGACFNSGLENMRTFGIKYGNDVTQCFGKNIIARNSTIGPYDGNVKDWSGTVELIKVVNASNDVVSWGNNISGESHALFEANMEQWNTAEVAPAGMRNGGGTITQDSTIVRTGTYSMKHVHTAEKTQYASIIIKPDNAPLGQWVYFDGWCYVETAGKIAFVEGNYNNNGGTAKSVFHNSHQVGKWHRMQCSFFVRSYDNDFNIRLTANNGTTVYWDDITVKLGSYTPPTIGTLNGNVNPEILEGSIYVPTWKSSGTPAIRTFKHAWPGRPFTIVLASATDFTHNGASGAESPLILAGAVDFTTGASGDTITFVLSDDNNIYEVSRSVNN